MKSVQVQTALLAGSLIWCFMELLTTYRHVGHRSYPRRKTVSACLCLATNPEISQFHHSILVKQDVRWFYISMYHVLLVQVGQTLQNLHSYEADDRLRYLTDLFQNVAERAAIHKLERDVNFSLTFEGTVGLEYIWMVAIVQGL